MIERYIHHLRVERPAADETVTGGRARLGEKFPRAALRRMTHLGLLVGSALDGLALGPDDALVYATTFAETRALEDYLATFPTPSPMLFQTSIHPSAVQQVLIARQQPLTRFWPMTGRRRRPPGKHRRTRTGIDGLNRMRHLFLRPANPLRRLALEFSAEHRLQPDDPAWRDLLAAIEQRPATGVSDFEERRWFSFKKTPTILKGEARVSTERGLSLDYPGAEPRTVIIDERGMIVREAGRDTAPPADARASAANLALLHVLRFNLRPLAESFETYGERHGSAWTLALVPRADALRRTLGQITVAGESARCTRNSADRCRRCFISAGRWRKRNE
ncbi:MAG: hypothetical protein HY736_15845 [Verrucomicrobia bacterium]|nr:hypothetical protein [Verrucomicrobiota bacterium]